VPPLAYLLTFSTYGTHLPGSEKGWVDAQHRIPGSPARAADAGREAYWRSRLSETPLILDCATRLLVLQAVLSVCAHRGWTAHALHVRTNHVNAVVAGEVKPDRMLLDFKAYVTALRAGGITRRRYWAHNGSTRYLWNQTSLNAAIDYVLIGQGANMACYPAEKGSLTLTGSDSRGRTF
jgi:hypothetical protein